MKKTIFLLLSGLTLFANSNVIELEKIIVNPYKYDLTIYENKKGTEYLYCNKNKYYYETYRKLEVMDVDINFVNNFLLKNNKNIISNVEVKKRLKKCQNNY